MLKFRIVVPGVACYTANFPGQAEAAADAANRFPGAPPAHTLCLDSDERPAPVLQLATRNGVHVAAPITTEGPYVRDHEEAMRLVSMSRLHCVLWIASAGALAVLLVAAYAGKA